jgi:amidase
MELWSMTAVELARRLRARELSAREVVGAHLERIEQVNPSVNAVVTLVPERAMESAARADRRVAIDPDVGPLHGLPIAHKDLALTAGVRTTFGSPIFADDVPYEDELFVERCRQAGAILIGKTNTAEFGAGSHTFNPVFGVTRNPHDLRRSAGGSSGGAAAALATGMLPIADGSDLGGSLRNPASFCGVVGFRPTVHRVPSFPPAEDAGGLAVEGPMGRTVEDAALLLSVMAGPDPRVHDSLGEPGATFAPPLDAELGHPRIAWAPDAAGSMPFEADVVHIVDAARPVFEKLGCSTEDAFPDLREVRDVFLTLRAHMYAAELGELLDEHRDRMKETLIWNIEEGLKLSEEDVDRAHRNWETLRERIASFFERFDFLVLPVAQVVPFDADLEYPTVVERVEMTTYLDWMESCWCITVTGCPAISVPCGFTGNGLPIGLQLVGRPGDDLGVLRLAHAFERASAVSSPELPGTPRDPR